LFDSENNGNGGYTVGDKCVPNCHDAGTNNYNVNIPGAGKGHMEFYEGSVLDIVWTNQHGSQSPLLRTQVVIQYMCDDGKYSPNIRDGY
jgi:hypothetical protein